MRLLTRLQELETKLHPPQEPPLRIVLVDEAGRWWESEGELDPAMIDPSTQLVLLRYRATDASRCG
jgi:hypothetical protein